MRSIVLALVAAILLVEPALAHRVSGQAMPGAEVVRRSLEGRGFSEIALLRRRGDAFIARAIEPRGQRVVVTVSGRTGRVLDLRVTHWKPWLPYRDEAPVYRPVR